MRLPLWPLHCVWVSEFASHHFNGKWHSFAFYVILCYNGCDCLLTFFLALAFYCSALEVLLVICFSHIKPTTLALKDNNNSTSSSGRSFIHFFRFFVSFRTHTRSLARSLAQNTFYEHLVYVWISPFDRAMNSSKSNVQHRLLLLVCWVSAIFSAFFLEAREHMIYCACLMRNFAKIEWTRERERARLG